MIHVMPGVLVASMPLCQSHRHDSACLELFQPTGRVKPSFIEAHQESNIFCNIRWLKSQLKTWSFVPEIITLSKGMIKDYKSDIAVTIRTLCEATQETAKSNDTVKQTARSSILKLQPQAKKSGL
jgi:hypothetical protein